MTKRLIILTFTKLNPENNFCIACLLFPTKQNHTKQNMDFSFHIEQGRLLLLRGDLSSIKKAFEHFITANKMIEEQPMGKPQALYSLALGNFLIGNYDLSYKIAHKAKRCINTAIQNSWLLTNDMRQMLGEEDIDNLINKIEDDFPIVALFTNKDDENFDENEMDFSKVHNLCQLTDEKKDIQPNYSNLSEDTIMAVFIEGQSRMKNELVYFDKLEGDVLGHVNGFFVSLTGNQDIEGNQFLNRIENNSQVDFIDEERYFLIDCLPLTEFLKEYKEQTKGNEPFLSFANYFLEEILKEFNNNGTADNIGMNYKIQERFHALFGKKHQNNFEKLKEEYSSIFNNTCTSLAKQWLLKNVFNGVDSYLMSDEDIEEWYYEELKTKESEKQDQISNNLDDLPF